MASNGIDFIPHVVINPTSFVTYKEVIRSGPRKSKGLNFIDTDIPVEDQSKFLNSERKANGIMSLQAKRKISKAIEYLVTTSQPKKVHEKLTNKTIAFRVNFITLTLPSKQIHTDKEIINTCLNSFFNECRKYHNVRNYVWRAEKQKNGNIHFHIVTDKFIPWWELRNRWNRIVNKLGYVDRFHELHNHKTPNSTDVHSTRKIKNLKAYLVKYMAKNEKQENTDHENSKDAIKQDGRIWGCNHELSNARGLNLIIDSEIDSELKKVVEGKPIRKYEDTYFTVYYVTYHQLKKYGSELLFKYFSDYLFEKLQYSEQLTFAS